MPRSNTTHLDPPLPLEVKDCPILLDGERGEDVPIFGQLLLLGVALEARGSWSPGTWWTTSSAHPRRSQAPLCAHTTLCS